MVDPTIAPPSAAHAQPEPATDPDCSACAGAGWLRIEVTDRNDPAFGKTVRCTVCNAAPIQQVAKSENDRAFLDAPAGAKRALRAQGSRRDWWSG